MVATVPVLTCGLSIDEEQNLSQEPPKVLLTRGMEILRLARPIRFMPGMRGRGTPVRNPDFAGQGERLGAAWAPSRACLDSLINSSTFFFFNF